MRMGEERESFNRVLNWDRGQQSFSDIKSKFIHDLSGIDANNANGFAFVTNQETRLSERKILTEIAPEIDIQIYHLERIASLLNTPSCYGIRMEFLDIEMSKEEVADVAEEFVEKIWFDRHLSLRYRVEQGIETVDPQIWAGALKSAERVIRKYGEDFFTHPMNIASPKLKNRYLSRTASSYAASTCSRPASADTSIISVDCGKWKFVMSASTALKR